MGLGRNLFSTLLALYTAISMTACTTTANKETKVSKITPSQVITETFTPTLEEITATPTLTETPTITPTDTPIPTNTVTPTPEVCEYSIDFLVDATIPDNTVIEPDTKFTKTWLVENTGNCDIKDAKLVYLSDSRLDGKKVSIPYMGVGEVAEISIELKAPSHPGTYKSTWMPMIKEDSGKVMFGDELWAQIQVEGELPYDKYILIDLSEQMLYAYDEGELKHSFLVSTGSTYPTPMGEYEIELKVRSQTMSGPGYSLPNVQWVMYFLMKGGGYAIHGTWWHDNFGTPMSHGCVNATNDDAKDIYKIYNKGDPVIIVR